MSNINSASVPRLFADIVCTISANSLGTLHVLGSKFHLCLIFFEAEINMYQEKSFAAADIVLFFLKYV